MIFHKMSPTSHHNCNKITVVGRKIDAVHSLALYYDCVQSTWYCVCETSISTLSVEPAHPWTTCIGIFSYMYKSCVC